MKKKLVVLTGAGVSAESGISTFRTNNGLWDNHRVEDVASIEGWYRNPQLVLDFYVYPVQKTFVSVVREAVNWTVSYARMIFLSLIDMVTGHVAINQMSGPVGIVSVISEATSVGLEPVLNIMALITINLGVFNLVPFPALDGGRLFFMIIELITGKKIPPEKEGIVHGIGFMLLIALIIFVSFNDIMKLIQGG